MNLRSHLNQNNQTYFAHMKDALCFSSRSFLASTAFLVHAILPFTFENTGSSLINKLDADIALKKAKTAATTVVAAAASAVGSNSNSNNNSNSNS